ncbi:uncharacterized protein RHOBADRAFT_43020 [Rhodotorula graminis WP1]|uniref:DUF1766-domain-containing protein n=1 Tax=Rhodotorula graminis (strain WP1) TaxID=578459 RepID=A0A194S865_RHOGW|nr:uncharacterized protein RHOBADRAFT_43020 [Rhodotorula graminis WP1]KPV76675.1 hypothetical protein RHOBADRAFT_43020 [Rhodotorula graminis WP1]
MGVFANLFRRDSPPRKSSSNKRPPLSTLDIPLPPPRPAGSGPRTPAAVPQIRSRFGPRDPYNVYDPPTAQDWPQLAGDPSRRHGPPNHLSLDGDFSALRLSNAPPTTAFSPSSSVLPTQHARPALAHASTSAPAVYPPQPARPVAPPPVATRPPAAPSSLPSPPPAYPTFPPAPPTLALLPSPASARPPAPPRPRSSPHPPAAGPSSTRRRSRPPPAKAATPRGRPTPAPVLPRSASAPSSSTSSDTTCRALSSSSLASTSSASDDSLPHPSRLGTTARSSQPRTPGSARRSTAAAGSATPRAGRAAPGSTPRTGTSSPQKRVASSSAAAVPQQQCAALTARSTRCTRLVRSAAGSALEPEHALEGYVEEHVPAYCAQHARGKLVESGCFVRTRRTSGEAAPGGAERWVRYVDWIPEDLPDETKALLRHYMALAVSHRDCHGFLYVHELVPKGSSPSLDYGSPALIKLGRSLRPIARLSQWRASCPSSEPIVRLFAPALPDVGAPVGEPPPTGVRNHHRWERLCLVELAGRAAAAATLAPAARTPCADCGRTHVECFLLPRACVVDGGWDELGWSVRETVERWARWCNDLG